MFSKLPETKPEASDTENQHKYLASSILQVLLDAEYANKPFLHIHIYHAVLRQYFKENKIKDSMGDEKDPYLSVGISAADISSLLSKLYEEIEKISKTKKEFNLPADTDLGFSFGKVK